MNKSELFLKVGGLISNTVYNRAIELYNTWNIYAEKILEENDCLQRKELFEEDGTPSISKIVESVGEEFMWPKGHLYSEDVIGDCSEDESFCYDEMTDEEVDVFVTKGIELFLMEKKYA